MAQPSLVPIEVARLRVAYDRFRAHKDPGLTWHQLAERLGLRHQTLMAILNSRGPRKCQRRLRDQLALTLDVPADWLSGEAPRLGYVPKETVFDLTGGGSTWITDRDDAPTVVQIARNQFLSRVHEAALRDFGDSNLSSAVMSAATVLVVPIPWKLSLLRLAPREARKDAPIPDTYRSPAGAVHLADAFTTLLEPWFDGERGLHLEGLVQLISSISPAGGRELRDAIRTHSKATSPKRTRSSRVGRSTERHSGKER